MVTTSQFAPGRFSSLLALVSFATGTIFLFLHLLFPKVVQIIIAGYIYVLLAILINCCTLLYLIYLFALYRFHRETVAIKILILLANIPIALLYLNIVIHNN
ncbi:hypothetical protein [Flavobacterium sp.]|uniref:hypothetical protein n=1 Tax=Flavobacterium sp. TaxID=239 RepID=UPI0024885658|nr:hypothetical protein [Flavobacterium sp.]MDI1317355.1 hypothetical protein [Flavobacterium sp.]